MAKKRPSKRSRGRPAFEPTPEQRIIVETSIAFGMPQEDICILIRGPNGKPITRKTLAARFADEIKHGGVRADAAVVRSLHMQAVGAPAEFDEHGHQVRTEQPRVVAAAIWWTKGRMGWREKSSTEHSGPNGGAIPIRLDSLTDAQLEQLFERIEGALRSRT